MVEVTIDSIRVSLMSQHRVVILKDVDSDRYLPIWIGPCEADAITVTLQEMEVSRPLTHDLLKNVIGEMGGEVEQIVISDLRSDVFYARIIMAVGGKRLEIDSRPSDALALAVRLHVPVYIEEAVMDKGYHDNRLLAHCVELHVRTYIPERKQKHRRWTDKPTEYEAAFRANRRRVQGEKGRRLSRWRSERCERTFAHVCETGGGRRMWLRGLGNATKAHVLRCAAYNLGLLLRKVFGLRKPRSNGGLAAVVFWFYAVLHRRLTAQELFRALQESLRRPSGAAADKGVKF